MSSMKSSALARIIERDLLPREPASESSHKVAECFTCGRSFLYKGPNGHNNGRFCSTRCCEGYDAGAPRYASKDNSIFRDRSGQPTRMARHGFLVECKGCGKEFDSKGVRCCSTECERTYRQRQEAEALMAEVGIDPPTRRKCEYEHCGRDIPNWRNGRRVSKAVRFCSPVCRRKAKLASDSRTAVFGAQTAKKCP